MLAVDSWHPYFREGVMDGEQIKELVRSRYAAVAEGAVGCCGGARTPEEVSCGMGYSAAELASVPEGANLGLGCGNPQAIAAMRPGEVVVDLGSGAGFDCFLAAQQVGVTGCIIGVDMTYEMLEKARDNAARAGAANVEFRLGEIEHLPIADNTADVVISNCVVNLVPDKAQGFTARPSACSSRAGAWQFRMSSTSRRSRLSWPPTRPCCAVASPAPPAPMQSSIGSRRRVLPISVSRSSRRAGSW